MDEPEGISEAKFAASLIVSGALAAHVSGWDREQTASTALAFVWLTVLMLMWLYAIGRWAEQGGRARGPVR
jgi:hypothetical protein